MSPELRYYYRNREAILAKTRARRAAVPPESPLRERKRARDAARYAKRKAELLAEQRTRRASHREELNARRRANYAANPLPILEAARARRLADPERERRKVKAWQESNPDKVRLMRANKRARKRGAGPGLSIELPARLLKLQRGCCACCRQPLAKYHLDHIMPLALGGRNEDGNVQLLCPPCNQSKHAKPPHVFMQSRGFLL